MCSRGGKCKTGYSRLASEASGFDEQRPMHPCLICGQPTTSEYPVCSRFHLDNEKTAGSVYAVWFPYPRILKVGFTTHVSYERFTGGARTRAKRRGWETSDCRCIWNYPGDVRTEAFMQAMLAFRWPVATEGKCRLSEWFRAPGLSEAKIVRVLDEIYGMVPADETADVPASLF